LRSLQRGSVSASHRQFSVDGDGRPLLSSSTHRACDTETQRDARNCTDYGTDDSSRWKRRRFINADSAAATAAAVGDGRV
jgi:hypothetical protein